MANTLEEARELGKRHDSEAAPDWGIDSVMRRQTMRVWLRLGAVFLTLVIVRNWGIGVAYAPSLVSLAACAVFDLWLSTPHSSRYPEWTAFAIGLVAAGSLVFHISAYGGAADAPALVITPATVLFASLLSTGPAAWAITFFNCGILLWVGTARPLSMLDARLLGNLALDFLVVVVALRAVFGLRRCYVEQLAEQAGELRRQLRRRRRLAGVLFHDINNHLQSLMLLCDLPAAAARELLTADAPHFERASRRIEKLLAASKRLLIHGDVGPVDTVNALTLGEIYRALIETFGRKLSQKNLQLLCEGECDAQVRAPRELFTESVMGNLVSNAIKFSPRGGTIILRVESTPLQVQIHILDSGAGVPDVALERLHGDQGMPSTVGTDGEPGHGFGLQLVDEHVSTMGGRLRLSRRPEGGTEALLIFPACA